MSHICAIDRCEQQALGSHELCYFHRKQRDGLIPVTDRVYYLSDSDMAMLARHDKKDRVWLKYGMKFRPWVINTASKLAYRFRMTDKFDDLKQEGLLKMWQLGDKADLSKKPAQIVSFLKQRVRGHLLDFIAKEIKWVNQHELFSQKDFDPDEIVDESLSLEPQKPEVTEAEMQEFRESLTSKEQAVLMLTMLCENPMTTREAAKELGYKSPQSISNTQQKILEKGKEWFNGNG